MRSAVSYIIPVVVLFILLVCVASLVLIFKRMRTRLWKKRKTTPTPTELRMKRIPVIESIPFWVPGRPADIVGIQIQPSYHSLMPVTYSTPKPRRYKVVVRKIFIIEIHLTWKSHWIFLVQTLFKKNCFSQDFINMENHMSWLCLILLLDRRSWRKFGTRREKDDGPDLACIDSLTERENLLSFLFLLVNDECYWHPSYSQE